MNIAMAFGSLFNPDLPYIAGFDPRSPSLFGAFASLFLHLNILHLLGNMVFLAAVGPLVEGTGGPLKFLGVYLLGGLAGVGAHWTMFAGVPEAQPLVGASGALAACVGYCSVRFMSERVPLAPGVSVRVGVVALIWVGLQSLGAFVRTGQDGGGTAYWAHLGGFLAGLLLSLVFRAPRQASLASGHKLLDEMSERSPAATVAAADAHLNGHPGDSRALKEKAEALLMLNDLPQLRTTLAEWLEVAGADERPRVLLELARIGELGRYGATQRMNWADEVAGDSPEAARALLESVVRDGGSESRRPDAMLQLATMLGEDEPERARLLERLAADYPLHPACELARAKGLVR